MKKVLTNTDRIWAGITGVILVVMAVSWFWERGQPQIYKIITQIVCSATSFGDCSNLLSPSHGFWESKGALKYNITMYLPSDGQSVGCYMLGTGPHNQDATDRMPGKWILAGSKNGKKWTMVAKENEQKNWKVDEKRYFVLGNKSEFQYFRLTIEAPTPNDIVRLYRIGFLNHCP